MSLATSSHLPPGRWRLNPRRPFRLRRFEDAAVLLDEMTGDTLCLDPIAADILEALRAGEPGGRAMSEVDREAILRELSALGLVTSPDAEEPPSRAVSG